MATEKCFLEADWLKTTDVISGVPVLPCPSFPRPPLLFGLSIIVMRNDDLMHREG